MSKKHFVALAQALKTVADTAELTETQHRLVSQAIADVCRQNNQNFDSERFLGACGLYLCSHGVKCQKPIHEEQVHPTPKHWHSAVTEAN